MKRAFVLAFALVLGLGIAAFAPGLSLGTWDTDIMVQIDGPGNITLPAFSSDLSVGYTIGGWVFGQALIIPVGPPSQSARMATWLIPSTLYRY